MIPRKAREALQLKPGDKLAVVVRGNRVMVLQEPASPHAAIRGIATRTFSKTHFHQERQSWD
jgi:bifunctional DNA-binding transcriptional regulator/antitoxin component of YhaV-PrlF toxin-antitoxin module